MKLEMDREELKRLLLYGSQKGIDEIIEDIHPADILDVLHEIEAVDVIKILHRIPEWLIAEVIDEEDDEEKYALLVNFSEKKQKNILKEMSSDEIADLLGSLDEIESKRILDNMPVEEAEDVKQLLTYAPDTAGGIMATEYISIKENMTVKETLKYLQKVAPNAESAYYLYVVDEDEKLKGVVSLREIVVSPFDTLIIDVLNSNVISVHHDMDQEEVAHRFEKYGFLTMPVINDEEQMLGIVTVDDIIDVLRDETTEDIHRLGGVGESEKVNGTLFESVRSRLPWLFVNLLTAMLASATVSMFEGTISKVVILATFMPIVAGMGGNAGTQTLTIVVRGLALGELNFENAKKIFFKEIGVGLTNGLSVGICISIIGGVWSGKPVFGLVIGLAMILNMTVATTAGFLVPLTLKKLKIDPALASAVFVTTATDVLGFFFFLGLATVFIQYLI
ncbi:magnesium transporter [Clostridium senegalense]|uniref:magnesium transporter n=1 Tax=Clostridium senegalense TaxID=1465809 RepID=UPI001C106719|nr:magnesium transporter [Clostridium senegalense]MBU5226411.1 magnesium transporter [Clostridium senegalense]